MTTEEVGAYIRLLCHQWNKGAIPNDEARIRTMAGVTQAFPLDFVKSKFTEGEDGLLRQHRLEKERGKQYQYRQKQAENGAKGGRPRNPSLSQAYPNGKANGNPNESSPSPSPTPVVPPNPRESLFGGEDSKTEKPWAPDSIQLRLGKLFNRRPTTRWDLDELKGYRKLTPIDPQDLSILEKYYGANIPQATDYRRHDLVTLLNNFNGELDRARKFKEPKPF